MDDDYETMLGYCEDCISDVKQFMYILYGTCVRFYNTVVEWSLLQQMKEDLIEQLTSLVFSNRNFSELVLKLSQVVTYDQEASFLNRLKQLEGLKPADLGINDYLTLDKTSNLVAVYKDKNGIDEERESSVLKIEEDKDSDWEDVSKSPQS